MVAHGIPTASQLEDGRRTLQRQVQIVEELDGRIAEAQQALEDLIAESKANINALEERKKKAEKDIKLTKEFLSPMRRLPDDLLRQMFMQNFESWPTCPWTLAAVCTSWRRIVLNMPVLWSRVSIPSIRYQYVDLTI